MEELLRQLIQIETRIAIALEGANPHAEGLGDGLCDRPPDNMPKYLYLNGRHHTYWYLLGDEPDQRIDVHQKAIRGFLECLNLKTVMSGDGESSKLDIWLKTSQGRYILRTGWETHTAKSALNSLITLSDAQIKSPITFSPFKLADKGTKANRSIAKDVLFFDVWAGNTKVMPLKREEGTEPDYLGMLAHINFMLTGDANPSPKTWVEAEAPEAISEWDTIVQSQLTLLQNTLRASGCATLGTYKKFLHHHGLQDDKNIPSARFDAILASARDTDLIAQL